MARSSTKASGTKASAKARSARTAKKQGPGIDRVRDGWGLALLTLAVLSGLGLYADAAGVVGTFLRLLFRGLFGIFGLLAPLALAGGGAALLTEPRPAKPRVLVGVTLCLAGLAGLWHIAAGAPGFDADLVAVHGAAGWFGTAIVWPLRAVAATAGAVVVLVALTATGLMVATATPPRVVARWVAEQLVRLRYAIGDLIGRARDAAARRRAGVDAAGDEPAEPALLDDVAEATVVVHDQDTGPIIDGLEEDAENEPPEPAEVTDTKLLPRGVDTGEAAQGLATRLAPGGGEPDSYELPSVDLLRRGRAAQGNRKSLEQMMHALERTLRQFSVEASVARVSRGPAVTRFELSLGEGTRVSAVTKLSDDLAYALATPEIRIVAPIPGKSAIGVEVPNTDRDLVTLGDVLRSPEAQSARHPLTAGIGVDIAGNAVCVNLAHMPHLLIAGATGSGKSVLMNAIVTSVLMRATPAEVRMILIDPKRVELNHYDGAPHLLTDVVTEPKPAVAWLAWTVAQMERRYQLLAELGMRNIDSFNAAYAAGKLPDPLRLSAEIPEKLLAEEADEPRSASGAGAGTGLARSGRKVWRRMFHKLVVIDELADLMMVAPRDVEGHIVRIAQMARAVGIHLVVATQRPSVDVVTGLIKANVPSRIALAMATGHDSRTILDQHGAEKLIGHGDMLFLPANASKPHRIQGCFIDEKEADAVVEHWKQQASTEHVADVAVADEEWTPGSDPSDASDEDLTRAAMELVVRSGLGSTSMLQRKLKIGFARAGRLMDELEQMGVVGPSEGPKARDVLITVDELEQRAGNR